MSDEEKPPSLPNVLMLLASLIFKREAVLIAAAAVVLLGAGGTTVVWAEDHMDAGVDKRVVPLEVRTTAVEADIAAVKKQVANVERVSLETNLNVRLLLESRGIKPIDVMVRDGGQ